MAFAKDFVWGAASSAYQIEGAAAEGGKGPSIWDAFCREEGRIYNGDSGEVACDHYHRYPEDVALMADMGLDAYRFSLSWPRIFPTGKGEVNPEGLAFYGRLVDELLAKGITPYVTLFHWDYPLALQWEGGWLHPDSPQWFARYTETVVEYFGSRVKHYITFNEPQCSIGLAFGEGVHAPGVVMPAAAQVRMSHHLMVAHGLAVQAIRRLNPAARVSYAPTCNAKVPASPSPEDINAAREMFFAAGPSEADWRWSVTWYSDPVLLGRYPADALARYEAHLPPGWQNDLATICQPLDFYCQNIYRGDPVACGPDGRPTAVRRPAGHGKTAIGWAITPEALYWGPRFLHERYGLPICITENGLSSADVVSLDGKVHDPARIDFLHRYLLAYQKAGDEGVPLHGYFQWSLTDNFEWARGYNDRFGLVYVDFASQQRIPKDSARWYAEVVRTRGAALNR